jgi:hypothetical protein
MKKLILLSMLCLLNITTKAQTEDYELSEDLIRVENKWFPLFNVKVKTIPAKKGNFVEIQGYPEFGDAMCIIKLVPWLGSTLGSDIQPANGFLGLPNHYLVFLVDNKGTLPVFSALKDKPSKLHTQFELPPSLYVADVKLDEDYGYIINNLYSINYRKFDRAWLDYTTGLTAKRSTESAFKQHKAEVEAPQLSTEQNKSNNSTEKYTPVRFLNSFEGAVPKKVNMQDVLYPNGDKVTRRSGLLILDSDGTNVMVTLEVPTQTIYYPDKYAFPVLKYHPDLGNILILEVVKTTEVATITAQRNKVVDYKAVNKLEQGNYAIPLDNKGCITGGFSINLDGHHLDYWRFQLEDCTLAPAIVRELSTTLDFK